MARPTRVALALGSGGARGYAHIGVIEALEARGYEIVGVAGTSMGAVVGGMYASGRLGAYTEWVRSLSQRDVIRLMDPSLKGPGAIRAEKILAKVADFLEGAVIEDLPIPFTAVATDLLAGKEVWFQQGPLHTAIRASFALPSFIAPVALHGRLLVDGGLVNPVPVAATAASPSELTVAVSLSELQPAPAGAPVQQSAEPRTTGDPLDWVRGSVAHMLEGEVARALAGWFGGARDAASPAESDEELVEESPFEPLPSGLRTLDVMQLSLAAMQRLVARYKLAAYPPDLLITIPKTSCRTLDFHRANEMIALGRERADEALDHQQRPPA